MTTDYNPYIVIDMVTFDKMNHALDLAIGMSEKKFPHLTDELKNIKQKVRDNAKSFTGTQNVPASAKKAY